MNNLKKERKHLLNTKDNLMKALNNDPEIQRYLLHYKKKQFP